MESVLNEVFSVLNETKIWGLFIQAFSVYIVVSMLKTFANSIIDYISAKWRLGPSCSVKYSGDIYRVENVGLFTITLYDENGSTIIISTQDWKKMIIIIEKH
jgi:hypothetical protein